MKIQQKSPNQELKHHWNPPIVEHIHSPNIYSYHGSVWTYLSLTSQETVSCFFCKSATLKAHNSVSFKRLVKVRFLSFCTKNWAIVKDRNSTLKTQVGLHNSSWTTLVEDLRMHSILSSLYQNWSTLVQFCCILKVVESRIEQDSSVSAKNWLHPKEFNKVVQLELCNPNRILNMHCYPQSWIVRFGGRNFPRLSNIQTTQQNLVDLD